MCLSFAVSRKSSALHSPVFSFKCLKKIKKLSSPFSIIIL